MHALAYQLLPRCLLTLMILGRDDRQKSINIFSRAWDATDKVTIEHVQL